MISILRRRTSYKFPLSNWTFDRLLKIDTYLKDASIALTSSQFCTLECFGSDRKTYTVDSFDS